MATTKTAKTEVSAREVIRARAAELRAKREETIVPTAVEVVSALASVEVAPTVVEFTAPTEENTMNTADTTPNTPEVPDAERIVQLLDLHAGIESDIEDLEAKLEALEARREEIYGSLDVYRSELDGSKLSAEDAEAKVKEVADAMVQKLGAFGPMMVPALFGGFRFDAPPSLDLDPETGARLCELLDVGSGASAKADYSPMVRALTDHIKTVASGAGMTDAVMRPYNEVLISLGLVRMAPPAKTTGQREGKRDTLGRASFVLPGYPDQTGYDGANASVIVKANGTKAVSFGGQTVQRYLDRVRHPSPERAKAELMTMAVQWAQNAGLLP